MIEDSSKMKKSLLDKEIREQEENLEGRGLKIKDKELDKILDD
jgi:hypothetical protein